MSKAAFIEMVQEFIHNNDVLRGELVDEGDVDALYYEGKIEAYKGIIELLHLHTIEENA